MQTPAANRFFQSGNVNPAYKRLLEMQKRTANNAHRHVNVIPPETRYDLSDLQNLRPEQRAMPPQPVEEDLRYGNIIIAPIIIGTRSTLILNAPSGGAKRVFLLITNTDPVNNMFVNFGSDANASSLAIQNNNGAFGLDTFVDQQDIYIIAAGAGTVGTIAYANKIPAA